MKTYKIIAAAVLCFSSVGCYKLSEISTAISSSGSNSSIQNSAISLMVKDSSNKVVFSSSGGGAYGFKGDAGKSYDVQVSVNPCTGFDLKVDIVNTWKPAAPSISANASGCSYHTTFVPPEAADYQISVALSQSGKQLASAAFVASVACANPTFTADSLNANAISVSGNNNLYTYNSAGVVASANGQPPYRCAWDYTGVGIVDSSFGDCASARSNIFSSLVSIRKVGLVVKDACNTSYSVSKSVNLANSAPSMPDNVFITGQLSSGTGIAGSDVRIKDVTYRAENVGSDITPCQPNFSNGTFSLNCLQNFGQPSSKSFGMMLTVTGLTGFDLRSNVMGSINAANAKVSDIKFITDQAGDQSPQVVLQGNQCTASISARVLNPVGKPCAKSSDVGSQNEATVEVYGTYDCSPVASGAGSARITGKFDGYYHMVDNCNGGGAGGGGQPPLSL